MVIAILEAGYPIRESKCWFLLGMRNGEFFKIFFDAKESVKREAKVYPKSIELLLTES